eukprot:Gb_20203 [translate_table: standard]
MVIIPRIVCRVSRSLVNWSATPHEIGVREHSIGVGPITGLASVVVVGYPHMRTMVRDKILVEIRLVAPIWKHCGIMSKVTIVATPGVVIGPISTHIHVLVVVEALSGWTDWHAGCDTVGVSSVDISLGMVGLCIALWSLTVIPLAQTVITKSDFQEVVDNKFQYFFETPTVGREDQEMPLMALPLGDVSLSLQEGQFLLSPYHWALEYEQNSYLRLLETRHFEGMHHFVSCLQGWVRSPYVYHVLGVNISAWAPCSYPLGSIRRPLGSLHARSLDLSGVRFQAWNVAMEPNANEPRDGDTEEEMFVGSDPKAKVKAFLKASMVVEDNSPNQMLEYILEKIQKPNIQTILEEEEILIPSII